MSMAGDMICLLRAGSTCCWKSPNLLTLPGIQLGFSHYLIEPELTMKVRVSSSIVITNKLKVVGNYSRC
ncbi:unnamed protein product [Clavelina lepadiformis]|uniref:Uncharacterized protein n=1 Tax=Clavelina lepadiformis TaxID=159417 RepID=A0ABP0G7E4_CLALP